MTTRGWLHLSKVVTNRHWPNSKEQGAEKVATDQRATNLPTAENSRAAQSGVIQNSALEAGCWVVTHSSAKLLVACEGQSVSQIWARCGFWVEGMSVGEWRGAMQSVEWEFKVVGRMSELGECAIWTCVTIFWVCENFVQWTSKGSSAGSADLINGLIGRRYRLSIGMAEIAAVWVLQGLRTVIGEEKGLGSAMLASCGCCSSNKRQDGLNSRLRRCYSGAKAVPNFD